jgi:putative inorganic carbon (HCO3(-)) transporter
MGFLISLVYIVLAILSPSEMLPALAPYRIELWLALLATLSSLPAVLEGRVSFPAQTGFLVAVLFCLVGSFAWIGWFGGIIPALGNFLPNAIVFYLVLVNFRTIKRLRWLAIVLLLASLYLVIRGSIAYFGGNPNDPMIFAQWNEDNTAWFPRMRAFGFLNDPNDLAQFLISFAPLLWLQWQAGRFLINSWRVLLPAVVLLVGVFLTHSRGGIVALAAVALFAFKDRLGRTRSAILAAIAFIAMQVFSFAGGRDVSMSAGTDRIDKWSEALEVIRSSPLFGIGYGQFYENYGWVTHNSYLHCAAELGMFGYFFWMALTVSSMSDLASIAHWDTPNDQDPETVKIHDEAYNHALEPVSLPHHSTQSVQETDDRETLRRWAKLLGIAFVGYLAAAFFLSRAYTLTLFLLVGVSAVLRGLMHDSEYHTRFKSRKQLLRLTGLLSVGMLLTMYIIVRIHWLK